MVSIGDYELAVMKALFAAGGSVSATAPSLDVPGSLQGTLEDALSKLEQAEYIERIDGCFHLSELAEEYLAVLGLI